MTRALPLNWENTTVNNLFQVIGGGTPDTKKTQFWDGTVPWISSADIDKKHQIHSRKGISEVAIIESATNKVPSQTLIVVTRVGLGKVAISNSEICFSQDCQGLLPKDVGIHQPFFLYQFELLSREIVGLGRGTTINGITKKNLLEMTLVVAPAEEQFRVVQTIESYLTRIDDAVMKLERVQRNLKRYRASVLKSAVEGSLVSSEAELARAEGRDYESASVLLERILAERRLNWEKAQLAKMAAKGKVTKNDDWKAKYKEPVTPDLSELPDLPVGWCWASIGQLAEQRLGKMLDKNKNTGELRPYIRNANLRWLGFDLKDVAQMRLTDDELESVSARPGDLVICEGGEPGRCAVWPHKKEKMVIQKAIHRVRPYLGIDSNYLAFVIYADALGGGLARHFTGSTIKHFTGESLRAYLVPIPPASEQARIVEFLQRDFSDTDELYKQVTKNEQRCHRLRQSILNWAFNGKLVNQDPSDEPASILLERIKAEIVSLAANRKSKSQRKKRKA